MKDKIFTFIIGLLIGAIITASGFLIYSNNNSNQMPNMENMQRKEMPDGETPPEKPSGTESDENRPEPPSKNDSTTNNKTN